jgi:hypothetical protein
MGRSDEYDWTTTGDIGCASGPDLSEKGVDGIGQYE